MNTTKAVLNKAVTGILATYIAVVVTLTTITAQKPADAALDAPLFCAVQLFAWASALLAGYVLLEHTETVLLEAGKSLSPAGRAIGLLWFIAGAICWFIGVTGVLTHFHILGWEAVLIQSAFVTGIWAAWHELAKLTEQATTG